MISYNSNTLILFTYSALFNREKLKDIPGPFRAIINIVMKILGLFSTHPTHDERIDALKAYRRAHYWPDLATTLKTKHMLLRRIRKYKRVNQKSQ